MNQSDPWDKYPPLQQQADRQKLDAKAWAAEEQANEFLDALACNTPIIDAKAFEVWLENLATNRAKKHRRRAALLHVYQHLRPISESSKAHNAAVLKEDLEIIQKNATKEEWVALQALAAGDDYKSLAVAQGCTVSALKTRISRCRKRLHAMCA
jgi:DNA-directed RNA polymerase specialized sigma24 family protein